MYHKIIRSTQKQSFFRVFGELYMEDYDTGAQDFNGDKTCLQNITMGPDGNYGMLESSDRCPNLVEKSAAQFLFRVVLYLVIFTINVILVNILIGQISITLNRVMIEGDKDYYLNALELKEGSSDFHIFC